MSGGFELHLVAFYDQRTSALSHISSLTVEVRTFDRAASAYHYLVVALHTAATVIMAGKEVEISAMADDKGSFDGVAASVTRCGVGFGTERIAKSYAAGDGLGGAALSHVHRLGIQTY